MTDVTLFYEKEHAWIGYNVTGHFVMVTWTTSPISDEYRDTLEMLIEAMKQFKTGKLVVDNRKAGALLPADQEWTFKDWHARALAAGHTHVAIIQSPDIFSQISAVDVMGHVTIPTTFFDNAEDAVMWIADFR
ncbi:hypothetical protein ACFQ21_21925 [Ohtaekwangia kribbensis]|jgi:hypothetical protein|uniref:STAS/SEC14 domain-containing protein n=1 Tax=Ohtaekwangia kribbensis TaxID=688913 RepID=A0ABW3K989_9BACT